MRTQSLLQSAVHDRTRPDRVESRSFMRDPATLAGRGESAVPPTPLAVPRAPLAVVDTVAEPGEFVISTDHCPERGIALINLWGSIGSRALDAFSRSVEDAIAHSPGWVLVDLTAARLDADGLALLLLAGRKLSRHHVEMAVTGVSRQTLDTLHQAGVTPRCPIYTTVDAAVAAIDGAATRR